MGSSEDYVDYRLQICNSCEHLNQERKTCAKVAVPNDPVRAGYIHHPMGIKNKGTRCPIRKWDYVPSKLASAIYEYIPISEELKRKITNKGLNRFNELQICCHLFAVAYKLNLPYSRSQILEKLRLLNKQYPRGQ